MRVHVINTGTELLLGNVVNTHLTFIARELFPLGLRVERQLTVPDGSAIQETLAASLREADLIFVTGGLGPTTDDITREAAAELLGLSLRQDKEVADAITLRLRTRGFPMTDRILRQADVPEGARVLTNANGTAPGLYLKKNNGRGPRHLFLLPGPPRELEPMFRRSVLPLLLEINHGKNAAAHRTFRIACVGESVVEAAIGAQLLALPEVELGYCARPGEVDVRVIGATAALDAAERIVRGAFGQQLYTTADENLEEVVVRLLAARKQTLAIAESCTGGALANRVTNVPGSSAVFLAGYVTYANDAKGDVLGVAASEIEKHGAVSAAVAMQMAEGVRRRAGSDHALATTGIAGPDGGSSEKPVGTVFIALASPNETTIVQRRRFLADRPSFKQLVTETALEMLRERLVADEPSAKT
ncbi:MAG: competence/damage-inducible protein A [Verrucomicrobiota bacterium]|nr:competence/damage-inducible protein A [Verrucomicrobiota bacterium]